MNPIKPKKLVIFILVCGLGLAIFSLSISHFSEYIEEKTITVFY